MQSLEIHEMRANCSVTGGSIRSLMIAPFFSHESNTNRPLLVSEVLATFGDVDIVTTKFDHQTKDSKKIFQFNEGRTIYYLPTIPYRHNISLSRFLSHFLFSLRVWVFYLFRKNEYDVIYASLPLNLIAFLIFFSSSGKLKIADVIDIWPDVLPFPAEVKTVFRPLFVIWKRTFALAVRQSDALLTVSDHFMDESIAFFRRKKSAAQRFYIGAKRLPAKRKTSERLLTIVYIGNVGHLYDFQTLLTSMHCYLDRVQFFLIGDGDRKDWLLSELQRLNIKHKYFGIIYDDNILAEILSKCDLGFNGYRNTHATFSYKTNLYFAAGLPILNSMGGDLNRLVHKHGLGFNYSAGAVESLKECIENCLSGDWSALSRNVTHFFEEELEKNVIKSKLIAFIRGFVNDT